MPRKGDRPVKNFTGRREQIILFESALAEDTRTPLDLLVIFGIGGIGKTQLLLQYKTSAREKKIPVAFIDGEFQRTTRSVLEKIHADLKQQEIKLSKFEEGLERHRKLQRKLVDEPNKPKPAITMLAKVAHSGLKQIPGVGMAGDFIDASTFESGMNWIYSRIGKTDAEFWKDPDAELTDLLVTDLNEYCGKRRLVLMVDTYEFVDFDEWIRNQMFRNLEDYALMVIAGRHRLGVEWARLPIEIQEIELKALSHEETKLYLRKSGIKDEQMLRAMIEIAEGHPLTLRLLAILREDKQSVEELKKEAQSARFVDDLLDNILKQKVIEELWEPLEAFAILRVVDEKRLQHMVETINATEAFNKMARLDFIEKNQDGLLLHKIVWDALNRYMRWRDEDRYRKLHAKAASYYQEAMTNASGNHQRFKFEWLYHRISADESDGIKLFRSMAEELAGFWLPDHLGALLNDANRYEMGERNALWRDYYSGRHAELRSNISEAITIYKNLIQNKKAEPQLRAYSLYECGQIYSRDETKLSQEGGAEEVLDLLERSLKEATQIDGKIICAYSQMRRVYIFRGEYDKAVKALLRQLKLFKKIGDKGGLVFTYVSLKEVYALAGDWAKAYEAVAEGHKVLKAIGGNRLLKARLMGFVPWFWVWSGRYAEAEQAMTESLKTFQQTGMIQPELVLLKDLGLVMAIQGKHQEAESYFKEAEERLAAFGDMFSFIQAGLFGFKGYVLARQGKYAQAEADLLSSLERKTKIHDMLGIPELYYWLGELYEMKARGSNGKERTEEIACAEAYYGQCLDLQWTNRRYFESAALTGRLRISLIAGHPCESDLLYQKANDLAKQYEYNDHLASLSLTLGHAAWMVDSASKSSADDQFNKALQHYQQAIIYALRYNRFLLDEIVSGRKRGSVFRAIIPTCFEHGKDGERMLSTLKQWWTMAVNENGTRATKSVSPITKEPSLQKAERVARQRERGEGSSQTDFLQQINGALTKYGS